MAYTTILSERKSTVGSPYCFYTVLYSQAGRSATTVTLDIQVKAHLQYAESFYGYSLTGALTVAGTTFSIPLKGNETWSGTTVHTIDKRITVSAAAGTTSLGASFKVTGGDSSATLTQTTCSNIGITRYYTKASISASNALIGEDVTISLSGKYPSTAICELSYEFEGLKKTLGTTADTSYPWELSKHTEEQDELLSKIPKSKSGICKLKCVTKVGEEIVGESSCNITLSTKESVEIDEGGTKVEPISEEEFLKGKNFYVAEFSKARVTVAASAGKGASISSYNITGLGTEGKTAVWESGVLAASDETEIKIDVTDTRGTTKTTERKITVLPYSNPTIDLKVERGTYNGTWTANPDGLNLKIAANIGITLAEQGNKCNMSLMLDGTPLRKADGNGEYTLPYAGLGAGEVVHYVTEEKGTDKVHVIEAYVEDLFKRRSPEAVCEIPTAVVNMSMLPENGGVTFGGHPVEHGLVSQFPAKFYGGLSVDTDACGFKTTFSQKFASANGVCDIAKLLLEFAHPVGSYYWSSDATSPDDLFGGTWERIQGRFVLAAGDDYAVNATGGEAAVALAVANMPAHTHSVSGTAASNGNHWHQIGTDLDAYYTLSGTRSYSIHSASNGSTYVNGSTTVTGAHTHTVSGTAASAGSGNAHNNMPPYIVAYCWCRTA